MLTSNAAVDIYRCVGFYDLAPNFKRHLPTGQFFTVHEKIAVFHTTGRCSRYFSVAGGRDRTFAFNKSLYQILLLRRSGCGKVIVITVHFIGQRR